MSRTSKPTRQRQRHFIREWRQHRQYDQAKLAEMIGMSRENLSKLERQLIPYSQDTLEAAAEALSCEPADLVVRNPLDRSAVWSIHERLQRASTESRERAVAVIDALLKTGS